MPNSLSDIALSTFEIKQIMSKPSTTTDSTPTEIENYEHENSQNKCIELTARTS